MNKPDITIILFMSLVMVFIAGLIGSYIKNKIWDNSKPTITPADYGKKWSAYIAFFVPLSSIPNFIHESPTEAIARFIVALIFFPLFAGLLGLLFGAIQSRSTKTSEPQLIKVDEKNTKSKEDEDSYYEIALTEINESTTKTSTWSRAIANSLGDENKAKAIYIQLRVSELMSVNTIHKKASNTELLETKATELNVDPIESENLPKTKLPLIFLVCGFILVILYGFLTSVEQYVN